MAAQHHKKLLMLCFHYPPAVSGGVGRSVRFAKYLPEFGWSPAVVTTNRYGGERGTHGEAVVRVGELLRRVGAAPAGSAAPGVVGGAGADGSGSAWAGRIRAGAAARARLRGGIIRFAEKWFLIPDKHIRWTTMAFVPALRMIRRGAADGIYTTSPPASAHVLGLILKWLTRKPWVMDLRDCWTLEPLNWYLRAGGKRVSIEKMIERTCFRNADAVVTSTPEAEEKYAERYPRCAHKIHAIPNGYDAQELEDARATVTRNDLVRSIDERVFVISHVGTFSRYADTGAYPKGFLDAVAGLVREGAVSAGTCRIIFAGGISPETDRRIAGYGLDELMVRPGPVSHIDALRIMQRSDLLLVYDPNSEGNYYIHGKLYEYLASGRPILGVLPPGAARSLLERSGHAIAVTRDDATEIGDALRAVFAGRLRQTRSEFTVAQYEGKHLTSMLAALLDTMDR